MATDRGRAEARYLRQVSSGSEFVRALLPKWLAPADLAAGVVFFSLSLISLVWSNGYLIATLDWHIPYDRGRLFHDALYAWNYSQFGGLIAQYVSLFPYTLYLAISEWIGWSHVVAQNVLFSGCVFFAGFGMYCVYRVLLPGSKSGLCGWLAAVLAGVFYVMNPFTTYRMSTHLLFGESVYVFLPLVFALFAKALQARAGCCAGFCIALIAAISFAPGGTTPKFLAIGWVVLLSYAFFAWLTATAGRRHVVVFTGFVVVSWLLLSSWYLLLQIGIVPQLLENAAEFHAAINLTETVKFPRGSMDLIDAFRNTETELVNQRTQQDQHSALFTLSSFAPALLAFGAMLVSKRRKVVLYFLFLAVVGLSLLNRSRYPSGDLAQWILTQLGLLRVFRTPIVPFGILVIFAYSIPFGVAVEGLLNLVGSHVQPRFLRYGALVVIVLTVLVLSCVVFNWSLWTGDTFATPPHIQPRYEIPAYYIDAARWLQEMPGQFRVFAFPIANMGYFSYSWDPGYYGRDLIERLFPKRVIYNNAPSLSGDLASVWYNKELWETDGFSKLLALTDAQFMVVRRDVRIEHFKHSIFMNWSDEIPSLYAIDELPGFHLAQRFGQVDFYENENWQPMQVYPATRWIPVQDIDEQLAYLSDDSKPYRSDVVLVRREWIESYAAGRELATELKHPETFSAQMINPVTYKAHVKADSPFFLVLSEMYHPDWKAYVGNDLKWTDSLTQLPLDESAHFLANGFANGWYVDQPGEYEILLYFHQQNYLYLGALLSLLALCGGGLLCLKPPRKLWQKLTGVPIQTNRPVSDCGEDRVQEPASTPRHTRSPK